jgi:hypothetical protein
MFMAENRSVLWDGGTDVIGGNAPGAIRPGVIQKRVSSSADGTQG